ncbi:MAG: PAS domain S-box protein [Deltaproteobacteria bacterium]|nr:PAS domain S-box protein [Deltaproteobacteria bacterium]
MMASLDDRSWMPASGSASPWRYGLALVAVAAAVGVRLIFDPALGTQPAYGFALLAVLATARYGGLGPALCAVLFGAAVWRYFVLHPRYGFALPGSEEQLGLLFYSTVGLGIALLGGIMRRAQQRSEEAAAAEHAAVMQVRQEVDLRTKAEAALREANETLEARVRERTAALAAASESISTGEAMLAGVVGSAMDGVVTVDEQRNITYVNPAAEGMFGYRSSDLVGGPLERLIPERYRAAHSQHIRDFARSGSPHKKRNELRVVYGLHADGTEFPIEASLSQMVVAGRRLFTATLHDITERKRVEAELRTSRAQLVAALEAGGMSTWLLNFETNTVQWDNVNLKLWGRIREEVPDDSIETMSSFLHPDDRNTINDLIGTLPRDGVFVRVEYRILWPDGSVHWHASRGQVERNAEGKATRYTGVVLDISGRKRAEDGRLRSQKLEALGTLAGGIAHDFNNILLAISGNTKLAVADFPADHPVQESLSEIAKAATRAAEVVKRILTFSRPQDQKSEVLQLRPVIEEVLRLLHATVPATIQIRTEFEADTPSIMADSSQVHQIIVNLTTNAADAIDGSGWIEFAVDTVSVNEGVAALSPDLREGRYVRLSVRDNGCGMDGPTVARIFDPFFTTKLAGTGLGLSVVHGIMKSHGGAATVYSEPGKGTTFNLYFPAVEGAHPSEVQQSREVRQGRGEHVLYVDDEDALVMLTTRVLTRLGYTVTGFNDPRRALEEFRSRPADFDVVITDLSMPHMPGFELAREMFAVRPDVPIVMTSGYVESEVEQAAKQLGVYAVILKPDTVDELGHVLDQLLHERRATH